MRIVLAGFMGTGKSVVGRALAERRGLPFVDLDEWIEKRAGEPVRAIFARQGEAGFRALERDAVRDVCALDDAVIAVGGGAVVDDSNRAALENAGLLFCLVARPEVIARRVADRVEKRPMLAGVGDLVSRIRDLLAEREPAYARIPRRIDTSDLGVAEVVERIDAAIRAELGASGGSS